MSKISYLFLGGSSVNSLIALDNRIVLHSSDIADGELPKPVIRPYPIQYI
ncbi:hypothetical protein [Calothrix sp. 336/3]|nr:hypothetical protein [Calothrix sp. 336/3]